MTEEQMKNVTEDILFEVNNSVQKTTFGCPDLQELPFLRARLSGGYQEAASARQKFEQQRQKEIEQFSKQMLQKTVRRNCRKYCQYQNGDTEEVVVDEQCQNPAEMAASPYPMQKRKHGKVLIYRKEEQDQLIEEEIEDVPQFDIYKGDFKQTQKTIISKGPVLVDQITQTLQRQNSTLQQLCAIAQHEFKESKYLAVAVSSKYELVDIEGYRRDLEQQVLKGKIAKEKQKDELAESVGSIINNCKAALKSTQK